MLKLPHFEVQRTIYTGRRSIVHAALDQNKKPVVVKSLTAEHASPEDSARLLQEFNLLKELAMPGILQAFSLEQSEGRPALVLEDYGAVSLQTFLAEHRPDLKRCLEIGIGLTEILDRVHERSVIHRDLKPANVLINPETLELRLADFGMSSRLSREEQSVRSPGAIQGTLAFISPEQTGRMNRAVDYRSDLYSLGVLLYEMFTGLLPFRMQEAVELVHAHIALLPEDPCRIRADLPPVIGRMILKLLAKTAEERYQSAAGVCADLRRALESLDNGKIDDFAIAERDVSDRFQIPQKLYGREREIEQLISGFEVACAGNAHFVTVKGFSGIGKSALVHEVHKPLVSKKGYFIAGKCDQFKRNIPYSSLIQAFQELIRQILTEGAGQVAAWKTSLLSALGPNGRVITEVIPELEIIIGPQPEVPVLGAAETRNRFNFVFTDFVRATATAEHPVVMFLDDLQWSDSASLTLLEYFIAGSDLKYIYVISSYRDNEVQSDHPLQHLLDNLEKAGRSPDVIKLSPLTRPDILELAAETLKRGSDEVGQIADILLKRTEGNPFFVSEFLKNLHRERALTFSRTNKHWEWELPRVEAASASESVVDLMIKRIDSLPENSRRAAQVAACIGATFDLRTISIAMRSTPNAAALAMHAAMEAGLVIPLDDAYRFFQAMSDEDASQSARDAHFRFLHDRVQQAAYDTLEEKERREIHLAIGKSMMNSSTAQQLEEDLFLVVNHFNLALELVTDPDERKKIAEFNLRAGKKAKLSTAYDPSSRYLTTGLELLQPDAWDRFPELAYEFHCELADTEILLSRYDHADALVEEVLGRVKEPLRLARAYEARIMALNGRGNLLGALETAKVVLKLLGVNLPKKTGQGDVLKSLIRAKLWVAIRGADSVLKARPMESPELRAAMRIMINIISTAYQTEQPLFAVIVMTLTYLSYRYGVTPDSTYALTLYGLAHAGVLGDLAGGIKYGRLGIALLDKLNAREFKCKVGFVYNSMIHHWAAPVDETFPALKEAAKSGLETGDLEYYGYARFTSLMDMALRGTDLSVLEKDAADLVSITKKLDQAQIDGHSREVAQFIANLRGKAATTGTLTGEYFDEEADMQAFRDAQFLSAIAFWLVLKGALLVFVNDFRRSLQTLNEAYQMEAAMTGFALVQILNYLRPICMMQLYPTASPAEQRIYKKEIKKARKRLGIWAKSAPLSMQHRAALVEAEFARFKGDHALAARLYHEAMDLAEKRQYWPDAGLAAELTARFHADQGQERAELQHTASAIQWYRTWGFEPGVKRLEGEYPSLAKAATSAHRTMESTGESFLTTTADIDLATIMKSARAISSEIRRDQLGQIVLESISQNAGAERGLLFMISDGELKPIARTAGGPASPGGAREPADDYSAALTIINYVRRTGDPVVIDNASEEPRFKNDPYIAAARPKSILCAGIRQHGTVTGVVYLENSLVSGAFTPERLRVIELLASQAAISLENASLYANLEEKVQERTRELRETLGEVQRLKSQQDADYFLTSLLIKPLSQNRSESDAVKVEFLVKQKKTFQFRHWKEDLGGDLCMSNDIFLRGKKHIVFANADAMGKSMQGAGGALVVGSVFEAILDRTERSSLLKDQFPERWLKNTFIEMHRVFESFDGSMLVSLFIGLVDESTGLMYFISAEHPWAVIYRDGRATFVDHEVHFRKLGFPTQEGKLVIQTLALKPGDVIIAGSDGRDDVLVQKDGELLMNEDENLFLKQVENGDGRLDGIMKSIEACGQLTDDISLVRVGYRENGTNGVKGTGTDLPALVKSIRSHLASKQYLAAAPLTERYADLRPVDSAALFTAAYCFKKAGDLSRAADFGERLRLRMPRDFRNLVNLAEIYAALGNHERALRIIDDALAIEPDHSKTIRKRDAIEKLVRKSARTAVP